MPSKPKKSQVKNSAFTTATPPALDLVVHCKYDDLVDPFTVPFHPNNSNIHPPSQISVLAKIFRKTGVRHPAIISRRSGLCVAGHGRLLAAQKLRALYPCVVQDFASESEELAFLIADNRLHELSNIDADLIAQTLEKMDDDMHDLSGYLENEIEKMLRTNFDPLAPESQPRLDEKKAPPPLTCPNCAHKFQS